MRPDETKELIQMGPGNETYKKCLMELFPNQPNSICSDCKLNPTSTKELTEKFINNAIA